MSEFARLEEKLAKLRQKARAPGEPRRLRGADGEARLAALVTEIDETILPRRLSFATAAGEIHLAVANRRLQALLSPAPAAIAAEFVDQPLADGDDPKLPQLGTALKTALGGSESARISAARLKVLFGSDVGVPAVQLARLWSVGEVDEMRPEDVLDRFLAALPSGDIAWLRIAGEEVVAQGGPAGAVEDLGAQAAVFLDGYFSRFETAFREPAQAFGTLIASNDPASAGLFFVEIGDLSAIFAAPADQLLEIAGAWQRLVAE